MPDAGARAAILREKLALLPAAMGGTDVEKLAAASHALTGADLKNVVDDAKLLFAHDCAQGKQAAPAEDYLLQAIDAVRANRRKYATSRPTKLAKSVKCGFSGE